MSPQIESIKLSKVLRVNFSQASIQQRKLDFSITFSLTWFIMSTQQEHILNQAKQNYLDSAEKARDARQRALEQYNREQDVGLVDNEMTFNNWVSGKVC